MYSFRLLFLLMICTVSNTEEIEIGAKNIFSGFKKISTTENQFSILTLNTWGLPFELKGHDHDVRFPKVTKAILAKGADIVCLQEIFNKSLRKRIQKEVSSQYEYNVDLECNRKALGLLSMDCYGGLITLSKYPIIEEHFISFPKTKNRNIIEKVGDKGFLVSSILLPNESIVAVINTHLRSGIDSDAQSDRKEQILFIQDYVNRELLGSHQEIILTGDLNMNHPVAKRINDRITNTDNYNLIVDSMQFENPHVIDPLRSATIGKNDSKYSHSKDGVQILDYCMHRNNEYKSIEIKNQETCFNGANTISDHKGIVTIFEMFETDAN